jgi:wyosine [tRNA(Phe)-imidazoG37] synthetase (radical SAM superfamily)
MATFLFSEIIFGPVKSRRLGISLGINLLPKNLKFCTFNCIYCECGWTPDKNEKIDLPSRENVFEALENKLIKMKDNYSELNNITFAGNGEPTIHPKFDLIIDDTIKLRDKYYPEAQISVLSNATQLHRKNIFEALKRVDQNIQKLDSAFDETISKLNIPKANFTVEKLTNQLMAFEGNVIIQTMFIRGTYKDDFIDNTTDREVNAWLDLIKKIRPKSVMIYPIDRDAPIKSLEKISKEKLDEIGKKVEEIGIKANVYY